MSAPNPYERPTHDPNAGRNPGQHIGFRFQGYTPDPESEKGDFERLWDIFKQLLLMTGGDVSETLSWMTELDREYELTNSDYGMADFLEDLRRKGYLQEQEPGNPKLVPTAKTERELRKNALEDVFGKLKKGGKGNHKTNTGGVGDEPNTDLRPYTFGDAPDQIAMQESIRNAQINHGIGQFTLTEDDLEVRERDYKTSTSTVLMIDISHSMILYGEDRITPAKKVAMALSELITTRYPKDTLDIIVFGNDAWQIQIKDLPYLQVGPYHTNTVAGLELAMDLLRRRKTPNKQIMMITDGKPTCLKEGTQYYKNSFGLDRKILNRTLNLAAQCRRLKIPITTFMIATDSWLQQFVHEFTEVNNGRAYYSGLSGLGNFVFEDFQQNRKKRS